MCWAGKGCVGEVFLVLLKEMKPGRLGVGNWETFHQATHFLNPPLSLKWQKRDQNPYRESGRRREGLEPGWKESYHQVHLS
jgi:hypothetical protein